MPPPPAAWSPTDGCSRSTATRTASISSAPGERQLVLKFYRPARWSDAQIVEEHAFTAELAAAELPVAAPLAIGGATLLRYQDFRFAAFPWMRGRAPELDAPEARQIFGRSLARIHQIGALRPFRVRPRIGVQRLGWEARTQVLSSELLPQSAARALLVGERGAARACQRRIRVPPPGCARSVSTATAISAICCGMSTARCSSTWTIARRAPACRICG